MAERPLASRPHMGQVVHDPVQLLSPERGRDPVEDVPLYDQADAVLRGEHVVRDPERGPHAMLNRVLRLRADERLAPRVDDDHDVARPFPLVLVREEPVEAGRGISFGWGSLFTFVSHSAAPQNQPSADPPGAALPEPPAAGAAGRPGRPAV